MGTGSLLKSLLVAVLAFAVVGVGVTELLAAVVWPSLLVGLPAGALAGVLSFALTYVYFERYQGRGVPEPPEE